MPRRSARRIGARQTRSSEPPRATQSSGTAASGGRLVSGLLAAWRSSGTEGARDGLIDQRRAAIVAVECNDGGRQHGCAAVTTGHREDRREREAGVAELRVQPRMLLTGAGVTRRMQQRTYLRHEQRESERDAGQQSWRTAQQGSGFLIWPRDCRVNRLRWQP